LSTLDISGCPNLEDLDCSDSRIENLILPKQNCLKEIKVQNFNIEFRTKEEIFEQRLEKLELENQRLKEQNKFLLEQLETQAHIEQPPK